MISIFRQVAGMILVCGMAIQADAQSCYQNRLFSAIRSYENGQYTAAVTQLNGARLCSDANKKIVDDWLKKCEVKTEEQRRAVEGAIALKGKSLSVVDSLKKIIALKYKWGYGKGNEATQVRYIKACTALGDYYLKTNNLKAAIFYYSKVTELTAGTDSDLAENEKAIKEWEKTRMKLTDIYIEKPELIKDNDKAFELIDNNGEITVSQLNRLSSYFFGKDAFFLAKPSQYSTVNDTTKLEYLVNPLYATRQRVKESVSQINLEPVADHMRKNPELVLYGYAVPHRFTMNTQVIWYDIQNIIIARLVEYYGISQDRIQWKMDLYDGNVVKHNGVKVWMIGLELGQPVPNNDPPPPHPNLRKKSGATLMKRDTVLFRNLWTGGYIYNDQAGIVKPSVSSTIDKLRNALWILSTYNEGIDRFYTIKNLATGHYLVYDSCSSHPDKDVVFLYQGDGSNISDEFYQSNMTEWALESKKVWKISGRCNAYLHVENRTSRVECGTIREGWHSAAWQIINMNDYNMYDRDDPVCPKYSSNYVRTLRKTKSINVGALTILYDYKDCGSINLFHSDAPGSIQTTREICDNNGLVNTIRLDNGKFILGGDWGIQIVFGNGVKSCIRDIQSIGTFTNGGFLVKASDVYNGPKE